MAAEEVILDPSVVIGLLAGGASGDPAPQRGELERLREVAEGKAVRGELGFEVWAADAGLEGGQVGRAVEMEEAVHVREIDGEDRPVSLRRVDVPHDARAPAVRNQADAGLATEPEQEANLFVGGWVGDSVGNTGNAA
jgi:hypothetical protein